jgi:hypothetical protein
MSPEPFDILKRQSDGSFIWLEAASNLPAAKNRLEQLCRAVPGDYFVFDQKTQQMVAHFGLSTNQFSRDGRPTGA